MEELSKFRQFINEGKEKTNEIFGLRGTPDSTKKAAKALDALEKALFELNFLDILGQEDYEDWLIKYEELRGRVMAGLDDESREKYDVAYGSSEGDLDENDAALDEIINEAKPNLKKALPTIAARNVERNNAINFDIEEMMDMVGEAGKGEGSEEAKILFKASNASDELEQALVDLQVYFEDDLGEGKDTNDEIEEGVIGQTFRKIFGKQEYKEGDIVFLKKNHREVRVILQAKHGDKSKRNRLDYRTQDEKSNLADPEGNIYYIMSEPQPINVKLTIDNAGFHFKKLDSLSKTGYREGGEKIYQTSIKGEAVWDEGKKRYMPK